MANQRLTTDLQTVLPLIRDRLVDDGIVNEACSFITSTPTDPTKLERGDQYAVVSLGDEMTDKGVQLGGNYLLNETGVIVTFYCRLALDEYPAIDMFLLDDTYGLLRKLKCLLNSLFAFDPTDNSGDFYFAEPLKYEGRTAVQRVREPDGADSLEWGFVQTRWRLKYTQDLSCED